MSQESGPGIDHRHVGYNAVPPPPAAGELGLLAIQNKKYDVALTHIAQALEEAAAPASATAEQLPELLVARSQAYLGLKSNHSLALEDTERAYHLAAASAGSGNGNVRLASLAQYRRAVVLGVMKRYADADACCVWSQHLLEGKATAGVSDEDEQAVTQNVDADGNYAVTHDDLPATLDGRPQDDAADGGGGGGGSGGARGAPFQQHQDAPAAWSRAYMWRGFVLREMQKLPANDPGRKLTVRRIPPKPTTPLVVKTAKIEKEDAAAAAAAADSEKSAKDAMAAKTEPAPISAQAKTNIVPITLSPPPPAKLRVDMYQSTSKVNLSIYAKKVDESLLRIRAGPTTLHLSNLPKEVSGPTGTVVLQLGGAIDETGITRRVTPYKIELTLTKKTSGEKWGSWGEQVKDEDEDEDGDKKKVEKKDDVPAIAGVSNTAPAAPAAPEPVPPKAPAPADIPAATKPSGPVYPTSSRTGPKNWDKLAADDDDDDDGGDGKSVDAFFKQLYANSTPEQQRAMNKSFTESNGTALSTDWTSVGKGKVEVKPPEGVEAKSWDERQNK
ncbi:Cochaperone protein [Sporothrix curviconia]|uniref:Cochaperone protein n=1 Tax=Sporothrix curviconia TaxID=1260050 RepID=A0ABP0CY34_9PEZI